MAIKNHFIKLLILFQLIIFILPVSTLAAIDSNGSTGIDTWNKATFNFYIYKSNFNDKSSLFIWKKCPVGGGTTTCPSNGELKYYASIKSSPSSSLPYYVLKLDIDRSSKKLDSVGSDGWTTSVSTLAITGISNYNLPSILDGETFNITLDKSKKWKDTAPAAVNNNSGTSSSSNSSSSSSSSSTPTSSFTMASDDSSLPWATVYNNKCDSGGKYTEGILKGLPCDEPIRTLPQVMKFVENVTTGFVLPLVGVVFIIMIMFGGILYITSMGNEQNAKKAKGILTAAIIGLLIVILAYTIITIFAKALGGSIS